MYGLTFASRFQFDLFDNLLVCHCPKDFAVLPQLSLHRDCGNRLNFCGSIDSFLLQLRESLSFFRFLNLKNGGCFRKMRSSLNLIFCHLNLFV
jgi:hypothetical protein